jgi:LacI family transcriptional regulator
MLVPTVSRQGEMETYRRLVDGRRADAMIVVRTYQDDERIAYLESRGLPFVAHGRTARDTAHAFIDGDGEEAFRTATRQLGDLGHRRIAHLGAPQDLTFARLRRAGWLRGLSDLGLPEQAEDITLPNEIGGYRAAQALLARPNSPTALLCATDSIAIGALQALKDIGSRPGRDVSVIGHDNLPSSAFTDPPLSTMEIADANVGRQLADMLLARIGGADPRDLQKILPVRQVPRATHAALP